MPSTTASTSRPAASSHLGNRSCSRDDLGDLVTLLKGDGSWVTIANPPSTAVARISLRNNVAGDGTCLGTVVVATYAKPHDGVSVRVGSGSSVAGKGPPPAPPL